MRVTRTNLAQNQSQSCCRPQIGQWHRQQLALRAWDEPQSHLLSNSGLCRPAACGSCSLDSLSLLLLFQRHNFYQEETPLPVQTTTGRGAVKHPKQSGTPVSGGEERQAPLLSPPEELNFFAVLANSKAPRAKGQCS